MSGGDGPMNYGSLPKDDQQHPSPSPPPPASASTSTSTSTSTAKRSFLSFRHLNCLAVIVVLAASGLVCYQDLAFLVLSLAYIHVLSVVAFPSLGPAGEPTVFDPRSNRVLKLYVSFAAVVGLFLPIAYIFEGIYEGDKEGIAAAAPHLFLLASQVFMEGVAFSPQFSTPIRVFVPVSYNARRIFTLMDWLESEFRKEGGGGGGSARRVYVGRILAAANMALWCFNLFAFLLPVYMPRALKKYYAAYFKVKDV